MVCELCGSPHPHKQYKIINKVTKKYSQNTDYCENALWVGSTCINHFQNSELRRRIDIEQAKEETKARNRRNALFIKKLSENNVKDYDFLTQDHFDDKYPFLLPYELNYNIFNTIKNLANCKKNFIKHGRDEDIDRIYDEYCQYIEAFERFNRHAIKHCDEIKNNRFACPRKIAKSLKTKYKENNAGQKIVDKIMRDNGILTEETFKYIWQEEFVKNFINLSLMETHRNMNEWLRPIQSEKLIYRNMIRFKYKNENLSKSIIEFSINLKDFMRHIGAKCIFDAKYTYGYADMKNCTVIFNDEQNKDVFEAAVNRIFATKGYSFYREKGYSYWRMDQRKSRRHVKSEDGYVYIKIGEDDFLNAVIEYFFEPEKLTRNIKSICSKIENGKEWLDEDGKKAQQADDNALRER